jgi:uncharacterized protein
MGYGDLSLGVEFDKRLDSPFSYHCGACSRCCEGKAIRVGPYEVLRLARHFGLTTTEFIAQHTQSGGTVLQTVKGNCSFLGPGGCTVHADRPLACRLYPLGMQVSAEGERTFGSLHPHPKTEGSYGTQGTVADYLESQQVGPFLAANDSYEKLYDHMVSALAEIDAKELALRPEHRARIDEMDVGTLASAWMDIDGIVESREGDTALSPEELVGIHIQHIERLVDDLDKSL